MSVQDHGLEAIRKSAKQVTPGDNTEQYIRVGPTDGQPLDINGEFVFSGLSTAIKISTETISDVASPVPLVSLVGRNSISIQNKSGSEILYVGPSNVEANSIVGGNGGWEIPPSEALNFDIKDTVIVYGIAPAGKTILVKILEMA